HANVLALDVEVERAADRVFTSGNGFQRRHDAVHGGNLQRVAVLVIEGETKDANGVGISGQAGEGLGVVTRDFHHDVLTESGFDVLVGEACWQTGGFGAGGDNPFLEDFTGAVVGARNGQCDRLVRQRCVDLVPGLVGIVDQLAIDRNLGGNGLEHLNRGQGEVSAIGGRGKDDAIKAELNFTDIGHASSGAGFAFAVAHRAGSVG